jgi:hypothetical protein
LFCAACGNINEATGNERAAMGIFASPGHKFGQLKIHDTAMASSKSPIRSRSLCPHCGSPLYYVNGFRIPHGPQETCLPGSQVQLCGTTPIQDRDALIP